MSTTILIHVLPGYCVKRDRARPVDNSKHCDAAFTFRQENRLENGLSTQCVADLPKRRDGREPILIGDDEPAGAPLPSRAHACKEGTCEVEK